MNSAAGAVVVVMKQESVKSEERNRLADGAFHLQFDQTVHLDGIFHREFFDKWFNEAAYDHSARFSLGEPTAFEVE